MIADIRHSKSVTSDFLVEKFKGSWAGAKHALFTAHFPTPEPIPIDVNMHPADQPEDGSDHKIEL